MDNSHLAGIAGFIGVGLALGLLGGGGGILAVPVLITFLRFPPKSAAAVSLLVVGIASAIGAYTRWRKGQLQLRTAALFAVCSATMAFLAPRLGSGISDRARVVLAICTMLTAAILMWRRAMRPPVTTTSQPHSPGLIVPAAMAAGTLTGLIGVGGGFLIVPVLSGVIGMPMAQASATSLAVIVINTAAAGTGYIGQVSLDPVLTAELIGAALVGLTIGTIVAPRLSARTLMLGFALLLIGVSVMMFFQEFDISFAFGR